MVCSLSGNRGSGEAERAFPLILRRLLTGFPASNWSGKWMYTDLVKKFWYGLKHGCRVEHLWHPSMVQSPEYLMSHLVCLRAPCWGPCFSFSTLMTCLFAWEIIFAVWLPMTHCWGRGALQENITALCVWFTYIHWEIGKLHHFFLLLYERFVNSSSL